MQPKFYADENVPSAVIRSLRSRGIDVASVVAAGMRGKSDSDQLEYAILQKRAIITHDSDFLRLVHGKKHYGIIFFTAQVSVGEAVKYIESLCFAYTADELKNSILFLALKSIQKGREDLENSIILSQIN